MRQIHLREDDVEFSTLVRDVEAGESVTILRGERPVAQIIPFPEREIGLLNVDEERRAAAIARLDAIMEKGLNLGGAWNGREELYDRD